MLPTTVSIETFNDGDPDAAVRTAACCGSLRQGHAESCGSIRVECVSQIVLILLS